MLTVDGDYSTNDIVLLTATGRAQGRIEDFQQALRYVCVDLARQMARDGRGEQILRDPGYRGPQ